MISITRYHDISMGHRVYGHESKCANLHGHNYRFYFTACPKNGLDSVGRVTDFSRMKDLLCEWLERNWDHKMMLWKEDPLYSFLTHEYIDQNIVDSASVIPVDFNPTAENIAHYFLTQIAPKLTINETWYLHSLEIDETAKCSAKVILDEWDVKEIGSFKPLVEMPLDCYCSMQCGMQRDCACAGKTNEEKLKCQYCVADLPF